MDLALDLERAPNVEIILVGAQIRQLLGGHQPRAVLRGCQGYPHTSQQPTLVRL